MSEEQDFRDKFMDKYNDLVEIVDDLEQMVENDGGVSLEDLPSFVFLTIYDENSSLDLPDQYEDDQDEFVIGKGVHNPVDILSYGQFLIQSLAQGGLGPDKTAQWLRNIRVKLDESP